MGRGFSKVEGIDYDETFAPISRYYSIISILALSAQMGWSIHQMNVNIVLNNGMIEEEVYIEQPKGFETFDRESHVYRLKRALYGMKQAPHAWYTRIDSYFTSDEKLIKYFKEDLARDFEMKDMGRIHYFLGMEVRQGDGELFVSQGKYANEILRRFRMESSKPMEASLADMYYAVNHLSQVMVRPIKLYWKVAKHVLRYLRGTNQFGLWYIPTKGVNLQGFTDADWAGSPFDRKSTSGGIFSIGLATFSWYNRKERSIALSLAETEYMDASEASCESI
eukprot:PITA_29199